MKQFEWVNKIPTFSELVIRNSFENLAHTECVNTPIFGTLKTLLQADPARLLSKYLKYFLEKWNKDATLIGIDLLHPVTKVAQS